VSREATRQPEVDVDDVRDHAETGPRGDARTYDPEAGNGDESAPQGDTGTPVPTDRANALRAAYGEATTTLREKHRTEFDALYVAAARKRGVDYKPKPTPEQKAEAELDELLTKYPHLKDKVLKGEGGESAG
jgi:hypothetical protein